LGLKEGRNLGQGFFQGKRAIFLREFRDWAEILILFKDFPLFNRGGEVYSRHGGV